MNLFVCIFGHVHTLRMSHAKLHEGVMYTINKTYDSTIKQHLLHLRWSHTTGWQRCIGCLTFMGHFLQKSLIIIGSFAERDLQLKASYASSPTCMEESWLIMDESLHTMGESWHSMTESCRTTHESCHIMNESCHIMNAPCHTINESCHTMNESCHSCEWGSQTLEWHDSFIVNGSCHTCEHANSYEWVMSHMWRCEWGSQAIDARYLPTNESCHVSTSWVMSLRHTDSSRMSYVTCQYYVTCQLRHTTEASTAYYISRSYYECVM